MKCIKCNSDIPDGVSVCPVCNSDLSQVTLENITQNNTVPIDTSVLPTVPDTPVLPSDQGINVSNGVQANASVEVSATNGLEQNNVSSPEVQNVGVTPGVTSEVTPTNVQENSAVGVQQENVQATNLNNGVPSATPSVAEDASANINVNIAMPEQGSAAAYASVTSAQTPEQPQAPTQVVNDINPDFIAPNGESVKLGNTLSPENKKKNNKKNLIIIIAIVGVLLVIGIVFFLYYNSQYKSSSKRIEAIVSALSVKTKSLKNDVINKSSGTYDLSLTVSSKENNMSIKADGTYAVDLSGKAMDYTVNLSSLNLGEELIDTPINLELYLNESRIYVLLQNYFDNYIYDEVDGLSTIFDANEQNNVDYVSVVNAIRGSLTSSLKSMSNTQTVDKVNIHGTSKKSNIIKINFNERNRKVFFRAFFRNLANNKKFISECAKLSEMSEDELKSKLEDAASDEEIAKDMKDLNIEIYTAMFGEELNGIKISWEGTSERDVLEIYPTTNGYGLSLKEGSQNVLDLTYESSSKSTSTTVENALKLGAVFYNEGNAYNIDLSYKNVRDVNPKDAKINVKNSINRKYLTEEQKQSIIQASQNAGTIGLYLPSILSIYLNGGVSTTPDIPLEEGGLPINSPDDGYTITGGEITGITDCTENPSLCE